VHDRSLKTSNGKLATWQLAAILVAATLLFAFGWNLRASTQSQPQAYGGVPVYFFSQNEVLALYLEANQNSSPVTATQQMQVFELALEVAQQMAEDSGAIVLHASTAIHVPSALNVSQAVYDNVVARLEQG
jgi:hypothetical protein